MTELARPDDAVATRPSTRGHWLARQLEGAGPWLVLAAAIAVYLNALRNGFALDDIWIIPGNGSVTRLSNLLELWTRPYWPGPTGQALGLYRPLTIFFYNLEWAVSGGAPWFFHAVNIALHATVSVLVYVLLRRWLGRAAALVGALVFAVHPVHTEAVANVVGQAELLAALFTLAACLVLSSARLAARPAARFGLIGLCYAAAVAAKENALVMPALLGLVMAVEAAPGGWRAAAAAWLREWRLFALLAAIALLMLVVRWLVLGSALSVEAPWVPFADDPPARVLTALRLWIDYARLLFFPLDLSSDYSVAVILPAESVSLDVVVGSLLMLATVLLVLLLPRLTMVGLGAGWFLVTILPTSNLFVVAGVVIAERALYLPSVGLAFVLGAAFTAATSRRHGTWRAGALAATVLVVVAMGARTWIRNPDWASTQAVNVALLRDHPESYKSQWFAAGTAFARGDTLAAADRFTLAIRMQPNAPPLLADYGEFLLHTDQPDSATRVLERAAALPHYPSEIDNLLALAYLRTGDCSASLDRLRVAREHSAAEWQRRLLTVQTLVALGRLRDAAETAPAMAAAPGPARAYRWALAARIAAQAGLDAQATAAADSGRALSGDYARIEASAADALDQLGASPCRMQ